MADLAVLRRRANELGLAGKHEKAARLYEVILRANPRDPQIAMRLGQTRRKTGEYALAARCYEHAASMFERDGFSKQADGAARAAVLLRCKSPPRRQRVDRALLAAVRAVWCWLRGCF